MSTIKRVEDIEAWKKARELTRAVYECSKVEPFSKDFALRNQMRRAAVSVMSNIAEGFERGARRSSSSFWRLPRDLPGRSKLNFLWPWIKSMSARKNSPAKEPYSLHEETHRRLNELPSTIWTERGKVQRTDCNPEPGTLNPERSKQCLQNSISSSE